MTARVLHGIAISALLFPLICSNAEGQTVFPGREWQRSTPKQQKMNAQPLNEVVQKARDGVYGNIDEIVITRNGVLVLAEKFNRDYNTISRGEKTAIGCGVEACTAAEEADPFNYLHPKWHPYFQGQPVHTLQSVTKWVLRYSDWCRDGAGQNRRGEHAPALLLQRL